MKFTDTVGIGEQRWQVLVHTYSITNETVTVGMHVMCDDHFSAHVCIGWQELLVCCFQIFINDTFIVCFTKFEEIMLFFTSSLGFQEADHGL